MSGEQTGPSKETEQVATKCFECGRKLTEREINEGRDTCYPDCVATNPIQDQLIYA
jgi:hypothetical protein